MSDIFLMKEPTSEQCSEKELVYQDDRFSHYACWYPQMGGYSAKCIVVVTDESTCFDAYVWHDGEFPFNEERDGPPAAIHHCCASQFTRFGQWMEVLTKEDEE